MGRLYRLCIFLFLQLCCVKADAQGGIIGEILGRNDSLHPQVRMLQKKLGDYESISKKGGFTLVTPCRDSVKACKKGSTVLQLRERLEEEGYLRKKLLTRSDTFDLELVEALKKFQRNNGLAQTGYLNKKTFQALNVPAEKKSTTITINIDRWKRLPEPEQRYILVNVSDFKLDVFEGKKSVKSMKVVVGKADRQTPVFTSTLTYLVLNPTWNIPQNVLKKDILPKVKKDPSYLSKNNMSVYYMDSTKKRQILPEESIDWSSQSLKHFPYEIIQAPGPNNSLGVVKFMFPNTFSVYMHDSPAKKLFDSELPLYSSGCVRLSDALGLAEYVLSNEGWSAQKLREAIAGGQTQTVVLKKPIPVFIEYVTAWVDEEGFVQFRSDIYGLDKEPVIGAR